jgi:uncharacterized protein (TIGR02147 family)
MSFEIYQCADHREFLQKSLAGRKTGLRALARKAGFKSAGHLTMLIKGERKLTTRSAEMLSLALDLKGRKRALLFAFSRLDAGRTEKERNQAREEIQRLKSYRPEHRLNAAQYSFLATWYYPAIYALLENVTGTMAPSTIAQALGRGVTSTAVEKALADLALLGLIERDDQGGWRPLHAALATPEDVRDLAIGKYHRNMIALAEEALQLPLDAREFNGLTISVPTRLLPSVKEKIRRFRDELNESLSRERDAGDIYQLNLQLFPLTRGLERRTQ